jgi:hypothetical protein
MPTVPAFKRKFQGYLLRLQSNIAFVLPALRLENPIPSTSFNECAGIDSPYIRTDYIIDLLSSNLYLPCLNLRFLHLDHYLIDAFVLFKANVAFSLWEDLRVCIVQMLEKSTAGARRGALRECRVSANPFSVITEPNPTAPLFLLLEIAEGVVRDIVFMRSQESGAMLPVSGTVTNRLNYVYEMNPATLPSYQTLITITRIYAEFGERLIDTLEHIWLGHSSDASLIGLQPVSVLQ